MVKIDDWLKKRKVTFGLAIFFVVWYFGQLIVYQYMGKATAIEWYYFQKPPNVLSPGVILGPISHELENITHIIGNICLLLIVGGYTEPQIDEKTIIILVIVGGMASILLPNIISPFYGMWVLAGASGGIFAFYAYSSLRIWPKVSENLTGGLELSLIGLKRVFVVSFLLGVPIFLFHQLLWVSPPHTGHALGIIFGYIYYVAEFIKQGQIG